jgi:hypothetical protein
MSVPHFDRPTKLQLSIIGLVALAVALTTALMGKFGHALLFALIGAYLLVRAQSANPSDGK